MDPRFSPMISLLASTAAALPPKLKPSRFKVSSASLFHPSYRYTPILIPQLIQYRPLSLWLAARCYTPSIEASVIKIIESKTKPWLRSHSLT
jgi:hypothetical protein